LGEITAQLDQQVALGIGFHSFGAPS
jgi:hypothetical protein